MAKFLILLLTLFSVGCALPVESENYMAKRVQENKPIAESTHLVAVAPVIPSTGMWTGNNQLGQSVDFAPDSNNRQTVLKLDEWGPPVVWTVSLGLEFNEDNWEGGFAARGFEVQAEIEFGVGGATQKVVIDWVNGAQISLPMNAVNVIASYKVFTNVPEDLKLSVQLSRGAVDSTAFFTSESVTVDNTNILTAEHVRIPNFANGVMVMQTSSTALDAFATASNVYLVFYGGPASTDVFCGFVRLDKYQQGSPIQIPQAARFVALINLGGGLAGPFNMQYQFPIQGSF